MRVLRLTQATPAAAAATAGSSSSSTSTPRPPAGASSLVGSSSSSSNSASSSLLQGLLAGLRLSGLQNPVSAVVGVLQQPLVRESAQEQLRRELQGEGVSDWELGSLVGCILVGLKYPRSSLIRV